MIHDLETIFGKFREIEGGKRGGDKIKISDISDNSFSGNLTVKITKLLNTLCDFTTWKYCPEKWTWENLKILNFSKGIEESLNNGNYLGIINKQPLSFAITGTRKMEYALEQPDILT